ncbi:unnamed protein product [Wuchereria bancrofti]|uniref:Uncharacterized protein n=2 Tax=Wuchereria bancrofti TaxID=6293 RepID=A0A3P7EJD7_WUCBA|nr:unnamed protein product [Wuchereria bancrofti]
MHLHEESLVATPHNNGTEEESQILSDESDDDHATDSATASAIKQFAEVLEVTGWENYRKRPQEVPKEPDLNNE